MQAELARCLETLSVRNAGVLVGVSGGADSVALLLGLRDVAAEFQLRLVVAHFDHALRGESRQDAIWVSELAARLQLPFVSERRQGNLTDEALPEESARRLRYDFFISAATQLDCQYVAVAHTADDQAETVLHHIIRGTGILGLAGIPLTRELTSGVRLLRPLLKVQRSALVASLGDWRQPYLTDSSNADARYTRNRIRHDLLPQLREKFNPQVDSALARLAQQANDAQEAIEAMASGILLQACLDLQAETVRLDRTLFLKIPVAVVRQAVQTVWQQAGWRRQQLGFHHIDQIAGMLQTGKPNLVSLPHGYEAACRGSLLEIRKVESNG